MAWFYYICHCGPGHQSESDGFVEDEGKPKEVADNLLDAHFRDVDWPIIYVWAIPHPPQSVLDAEREGLERSAKRIAERLKELETLSGSASFSEAGEDAEIRSAIAHTVRNSLMKHLHKRGVIVESRTIDRWRRGEEKPNSVLCRDAVLLSIKKCEKYPDYTKKKKAKAKHAHR